MTTKRPLSSEEYETILATMETGVDMAEEQGINMLNIEVPLDADLTEFIEDMEHARGYCVHDKSFDDYLRGPYRVLQITTDGSGKLVIPEDDDANPYFQPTLAGGLIGGNNVCVARSSGAPAPVVWE